MSNKPNTLKNSVIYGIGGAIRNLSGLILLPIYTLYLTPSDYGVISLFTLIVEVSAILIGMRITQAMFRYYKISDSDEEKSSLVSTVMILVLGATSCGVLLLYFLADQLNVILIGNTNYINEFTLFIFTLISSSLVTVGMTYLRAQQKALLFVILNLSLLILQIILNLYFIIYMEYHVYGVVLSSVISSTVFMVFLSTYILRKTGTHFSKQLAKKLYLFTYPLIIASIAGAAFFHLPTYLVRVTESLASVGLFMLANKLCSVITIIETSFHSSWSADRYDIYKNDNAAYHFNFTFKVLLTILFLACTGIAFFSKDLLQIMSAPEYHSAYSYTYLLALIASTATIKTFCNFGIHLSEKTKYIAKYTWTSLVFFIALIAILVPLYGVTGLLWSLLIAKVLEIYLIHRKSTGFYDMQLKWSPLYYYAGIYAAFVVMNHLPVLNQTYGFFIKVPIYLLAVLVIFKLPFWSKKEKEALLITVGKFKQRIIPAKNIS